MKVSTYDILVDQGGFEPEIARAIGKAIEYQIRSATLDPLPVTDLT